MAERFWHADLAQVDVPARVVGLVHALWNDAPRDAGPFRFIERAGSVTLDRKDPEGAADLGNLDDCVRIRLFGQQADVHARRLDWEGAGGAWRLRVATGVDLAGLGWLSLFERDALMLDKELAQLPLFGLRLQTGTGWYEGMLPRPIVYPVAGEAKRVVLKARRCVDARGRTVDWRFLGLEEGR